MSEYYYLNERREPQGPHTLTDLADMMASGRVTPMTLIACKGAASWEPLGSVLSSENISTPGSAEENALGTPGDAGNCPRCHQPVTTVDGKLPSHCPYCHLCFCTPKPGIWSHFINAFRCYAQFSGRATRAEYWSFQLINMLICLLFYSGLVGVVIGAIYQLKDVKALAAWESAETEAEINRLMVETIMNSDFVYLLPIFAISAIGLILWMLISFIPALSLCVRRLHDVGWSGWWLVGNFAFSVLVSAVNAPISIAESRGVDMEPGLYTSIGGILSLLSYCVSLFLFVLTLMNSVRGANKYGPSSKYPLG